MFETISRYIGNALAPAIIVICSLAAESATAVESETANLGTWESSSNSERSEDHAQACTLQTTSHEGLTVRLSPGVRKNWILSFAKSGWNSTIGDGQRFYLKVDNGPFYQFASFVDEQHTAHTFVSSKKGLFRALLNGRILKIANETTVASIQLGDIKQVIKVLEDCAGVEPANHENWNISQVGNVASSPRS